MTFAPVAGVTARIASIEARFGVSGTGGTVTSGPGFESIYRASDTQRPVASTTPFSMPTLASHSSLGAAVDREIARFATDPPTGSVPNTPSVQTPGASVDQMASAAGDRVPPGIPWADQFAAAGARHGVPPALLAAIGWVESNYQPDVVSPAGAIGLMQLMPFVADHLGVDARDPVQAIDGAARLLADHHRRFGSWDLATAAYFSGAGAVAGAGNAIPTDRSAAYVAKVQQRMQSA